MRILIGEVEIANLTVSDEKRFIERMPVRAEDLGEERLVEFTIRVEHSVPSSELMPHSTTDRRMGLKVFFLHLGPR